MSTYSLRSAFPYFNQANSADTIYLDSAATSQKPQCVIDALVNFYQCYNSNVHRASYESAKQATSKFELAREGVRQFINAADRQQIIWTKGATEGINLVAHSLSQGIFKFGQNIVISATEHHANIVPWQEAARRCQMEIRVIPVDNSGCWLEEPGLALIDHNTAIVALGQVSNALGNINPIEAFIRKAKSFNALSLIDGAQSVAHQKVDVQALDCDFFVFSGHKVYGPTGIGVLYGKTAILSQMPVFLTGGEMIEKVTFEKSYFQDLPFKFEAGTPNIAGAIGLHAALDFVQQNAQQIQSVEQHLQQYLLKKLTSIADIQLWGDQQRSTAIVSLSVKGLSCHDLGILLNEQGIAVRVGHHCAMPLLQRLNLDGLLRISLACYNTPEEIDKLVASLGQAIDTLQQDKDVAEMGDGTTAVYHQAARAISDPQPLHDLPLAQALSSVRGWDQVYRQVMLAGKSLPRLSDQQKQPANEVAGCESRVWLDCRIDQNGEFIFHADSESKIIRGLLAILLEPIQHKSRQQIHNHHYGAYLEQLGLAKHLSESRGNGIQQIINRINQFTGLK